MIYEELDLYNIRRLSQIVLLDWIFYYQNVNPATEDISWPTYINLFLCCNCDLRFSCLIFFPFFYVLGGYNLSLSTWEVSNCDLVTKIKIVIFLYY